MRRYSGLSRSWSLESNLPGGNRLLERFIVELIALGSVKIRIYTFENFQIDIVQFIYIYNIIYFFAIDDQFKISLNMLQVVISMFGQTCNIKLM